MTRMTALASGLLLALAVAGSAHAQSVEAQIEARVAAFERAFNDHDAAAMVEVYTDDAAILPPHSPRLEGRQEIARYWRDLMDAGVSQLNLNASEVTDSGDFAYEVGTYSATAPGRRAGGPPRQIEGSYLLIWTKDADGNWRLHRDIWNIGALR